MTDFIVEFQQSAKQAQTLATKQIREDCNRIERLPCDYSRQVESSRMQAVDPGNAYAYVLAAERGNRSGGKIRG